MKCALIWPDTHAPWHHVKACKLVLTIAQTLGIDYLYLLGDLADFYGINGHGPRNPGIIETLKTEVESVISCLDTFDRLFPNAKKYYIEGNHEFRLQRYIQNVAPALFGMVDNRSLFGMHTRPGWSYIDWKADQKLRVQNTDLWLRHRPPGSTARLAATKSVANIIYGDIHRIEEAHIVGLDGKNYVAACPGWLGDKRKDEIFGYVPSHHQWQLGFGLVWIDELTDEWYHQLIRIHEHADNKVSAVVGGKLYVI